MSTIKMKIKKEIELIIGLLFIMLYGFRLISLDADLPPYGITGFQQIDEGSYSYLALNSINYGAINPDFMVDDVNQYTAPHLRTNFMENLFTYVGLNLLGDNYYGLRVGSFICMLLNYFILYFILKRLGSKYGKTNIISIWATLLYLVFDFMMTAASKVVEPSIYRMFFLELTILIYITIKNENNWKYLLLGLLSVFSVFGIYITNIFIVFACIFTIIFSNLKKGFKKTVISLLCYGIGGSISLIACNIYYIIFWHTNIIENSLLSINNFSSYIEYSTATSFLSLARVVLRFFGSNFNLYNIGLCYTFMLVFPVSVIWTVKKKDDVTFLLCALFIIFFLQTIYSEDFIMRKYILIVPVMISIIYTSFYLLKNHTELFLKFAEGKKIFLEIYVFLCALFCFVILIYRTKVISDGSLLDYSKTDLAVIILTGSFSIFAILLYTGIKIFSVGKFKTGKKNYKIAYLLSIMLLLTANIYMNVKYIYTNRTYGDKNIMIEISNMNIDSKYIIGNYFLGFTLYNNHVPVVNYYPEMKEMLIANPDYYYFDYGTNFVSPEYIVSILGESEYELVLDREFERQNQTLGLARNVAFYKVMPKQ